MRLVLLFLAAMASITIGAGALRAQEVADPLEPVNRAIFKFNDTLDRNVLEPVARGYVKVTPEPVRRSVSNFLANLRTPVIFVNDLLQGQRELAGVTLGRFMINSTLGVGGLFDAASVFGYKPHEDDFGRTLGVYGLGSGPFLMLPFLGPSNVRDTAGTVADFFFDPLNQCCINSPERYGRRGTSIVSDRAQNLGVIDDLRRNSIDFYATVRSAYAQRRAALIRGNRPAAPNKNYEDIFKDPEAADGGSGAP